MNKVFSINKYTIFSSALDDMSNVFLHFTPIESKKLLTYEILRSNLLYNVLTMLLIMK